MKPSIHSVLGLLLIAALAFPATAAEQALRRIHVSGEGSVSVAPDMATLTLTVTRAAETAREALDASSDAMDKVLKAMRDQGVEERDLQTSNFNIQPRYARPEVRAGEAPQAPLITGYTVSNSLTVNVRDIGKVGTLLDTAVELGVNQGGSITLSNDDPSAAMEQARIQATKDALARAETLAQAAGVRTGDVMEISEQTYFPGPQPMPMARAMHAEAAYDRVPVASGENTYRVVVNIAVAIE